MPDYLSPDKDFNMLSLLDLLDARDLYHVHLMNKANVIATAIGRYRIRLEEPWPPKQVDPLLKKNRRTLENSEVRPYSWPCILVFVDRWIDRDHVSYKEGDMKPDDMVPKALHMPDGKVVPVCVVEARRDETARQVDASSLTFPKHLIGGGYPVISDVQEKEHFASIGCLLTDGHFTYALTNRHVSGDTGEPVYSLLGGKKIRIGKASRKQISRLPFEKVYQTWPGKNIFVNLDIGLIEIDDENLWTTQVYGVGQIGKLADLSINNISLRLIGCPVRGYGCASGQVFGEIQALFYRYKTAAGFEYVCDFLIGPRKGVPFSTQPGDSGTLWLMELDDAKKEPMPIAIQWGGHTFLDEGGKSQTSYALATCLSIVCNQLDVDLIRDWNLGFTEYWGAVGHYTIGNRACDVVVNPNLKKLMDANRIRISFETSGITKKNLTGLSKKRFVPLADVPDLVWKIGHSNRGSPEKPGHFADMDKPNSQGTTLLELCKNPSNVKVELWQKYYNDVGDKSKGLLPFRVWQIYNEMVKFVRKGDVAGFVCAAGVLSHYIGDACQPLHISYLHDGDPADLDNNGVVRGKGVHTAYENDMLNHHVVELIQGIDKQLSQKGPLPTFKGGKKAAIATVNLMQTVYNKLPPRNIVAAFVSIKDKKPKKIADGLWSRFGSETVDIITEGTRTLAMLWDSAWKEGGGNKTIKNLKIISEDRLIARYRKKSFLPSMTLDKIGPILK